MSNHTDILIPIQKKEIDMQITEKKMVLEKYYLDRGHYQIDIRGNFVEFTEDNGFKLTYNINSGPKFFVNSTKLKLPIDYDENDFKKIMIS